jgi:hypothetical protein
MATTSGKGRVPAAAVMVQVRLVDEWLTVISVYGTRSRLAKKARATKDRRLRAVVKR